ncbi:MAG: crossover junction endodeoxyribonuclease [Desulfobacter postgatei]|uniref:Crossover junction endodeoxyribonuclease RuvC n=1 Tax=Desulfobacter postgatei TaxID=2293 RepID=A0A2G6MQD8_9BACT|nr:MAG: crossover junction endodeoxyribonuclease [Desulfobacter postgatei]
MKIIGIDPGLAGTGVGVIEGQDRHIAGYSFGSISTDTGESTPVRLEKIYRNAKSFLIEQQPDLVVIEDVYSLEKYPGSGIMLGKVSGVLILAAFKAGVQIRQVAVREVKKVISGNGSADKYQVERAVRNLLNHHEPIRPFHASDALGMALTGLFRYGGDWGTKIKYDCLS